MHKYPAWAQELKNIYDRYPALKIVFTGSSLLEILLTYLHYLDETGLTQNLFKIVHGTSRLQKPTKTYLDNTNLIYLLARENVNKGNLRETFFSNQLAYRHTLEYTEKGDFLVDSKFSFEIGGKGKNQKQIHSLESAYIVADDILYGLQNKIPLWLFGFLY